MFKRKVSKRIFFVLIIAFLGVNIIAFFHAYKFTHFAEAGTVKTKSAEKLSATGKIKTLLFGVSNPRPSNLVLPNRTFSTTSIPCNIKTEAWLLAHSAKEKARGWVIICHGYSGSKSSMLDKAYQFDSLGYNTLLLDFMGSGGSEGNVCTIGFKEAEQVRAAYNYLRSQTSLPIYLFGTSMGASAVMRAVAELSVQPQGIIVECPFSTMYNTVCARFTQMNAPSFPMAGLLVFWGGVQNGYWAFDHKPVDYAKKIACSTLLMYGRQDKTITKEESKSIFKNLSGKKYLQCFSNAGHENYLRTNRKEWISAVNNFLLN